MPPDVPGGIWECPGDDPTQAAEWVLWCSDQKFTGMIVCTEDGTWDESSLIGCQ